MSVRLLRFLPFLHLLCRITNSLLWTAPSSVVSILVCAGAGAEDTAGGGAEEERQQVQQIIATLQTVKLGGAATERRQSMTQLIRCLPGCTALYNCTGLCRLARAGTTAALTDNFRTVLRVLLENLEDGEGTSRALVFGVLTEMIKQESLLAGFTGFTELVILKVLQAHKDEEKDVSFIIVHFHKTLTNHPNN